MHKTVTVEAAIHGLFLEVDRVREDGGRFRVTAHTNGDPEVGTVTLTMSRRRIEELGLLSGATAQPRQRLSARHPSPA